MIRCENVGISFDKKELFSSLHVNIDAHISILGENGAGKSSFAKALCNVLPFSGKIYLQNIDTQNIPSKELAKNICYIPAKLENADAYLKVFDFVLMGRYIYKKEYLDYSNEDREQTEQMLISLSLLHVKDSFLHDISSGEAQLVLIAQALLSSSSILIFDEPTANLDPKNSLKIFEILQSLKQSHTIILITHDIHLASYFDEDVLFIQNQKAIPFSKTDFFKPETLSNLYDCNFDEQLRVTYV